MTKTDEIEFRYMIDRPAMRPTAAAWVRHLLLLALTFCTATIAGTLYPFGLAPMSDTLPERDPETAAELITFLATLPVRYGHLIGEAIHSLLTNAEYFRYGISFSGSLLFILIS